MREHTVENALCLAVKEAGGLALKLGGYAGIPDRMCLLPGGKLVFVELKRPGEAPRRNQLLWQMRLHQLGFDAVIVGDSKAARDLIERIVKV